MTYKNYKLTILGCGSSGGVPRATGDWGGCDPTEPKNRRMRCSLLVEYWEGEKNAPMPAQEDRTIVLIDTSPDLREQLLATGVSRIDALLYTHDHADQTHGIDDLRAIAYTMKQRIPTYMDAPTFEDLDNKFGYCFNMPEGRQHPPILEHMPRIETEKPFKIKGKGGDVEFLPILLSHGSGPSLGFRFGQAAYAPDVHGMSDAALKALQGIDMFIVDALRYHVHPTHAHADKSLMWAANIAARQTILTNLHIDLDYQTLIQEFPAGIKAAYDGLSLRLTSKA